MTIRSYSLRGEQADLGLFMSSGFIDQGNGALTGTLTLLLTATDNKSHTVAVNGLVTGLNPEVMPIISQDTETLNAFGTGEITLDGSATISLAGTAPDGITPITVTMTGSVMQNPIVYDTPANALGNGLDVLNGITINEPCALADQLRAARLRLIAGEAAIRVEFGDKNIWLKPANLTALTAEIAKLDAQCAAMGGTNSFVGTPTPRSRRLLRINPYS